MLSALSLRLATRRPQSNGIGKGGPVTLYSHIHLIRNSRLRSRVETVYFLYLQRVFEFDPERVFALRANRFRRCLAEQKVVRELLHSNDVGTTRAVPI
jgi:hypothetical protein